LAIVAMNARTQIAQNIRCSKPHLVITYQTLK
jgi:hypothetical protein